MTNFHRGIEIERKYIIMKPCILTLSSLPGYTVSEIEQIYLLSSGNGTHRIRRRTMGGFTRYYETKKTRIDNMSAIEEEGEISAAEYATLAKRIDPVTRPIYKTRHTFLSGERTFEVDIYPDWKNTAIMETELPDRTTAAEIPPIIKVLREVTGMKNYSNAAMSRRFPEEERL